MMQVALDCAFHYRKDFCRRWSRPTGSRGRRVLGLEQLEGMEHLYMQIRGEHDQVFQVPRYQLLCSYQIHQDELDPGLSTRGALCVAMVNRRHWPTQ